MPDRQQVHIPLATLRALEARFDGPVPAQYLETDTARERRRRGTIAVLENQGAQFLDAAERCQADMDDVTAEIVERSLARWQHEAAERRLAATRNRLQVQIRNAAEAFRHAAALRRELALDPHPLLSVCALLASSTPAA